MVWVVKPRQRRPNCRLPALLHELAERLIARGGGRGRAVLGI